MPYNGKIVIFGGEKGKNVGISMRNLKNDIVILDPISSQYDLKEFDRASLRLRMYHCGFIIDDLLYSFGGQTNGGKVLNECLEMNLLNFNFKKIEIQNNKLQPGLVNSACTKVFYKFRYNA